MKRPLSIIALTSSLGALGRRFGYSRDFAVFGLVLCFGIAQLLCQSQQRSESLFDATVNRFAPVHVDVVVNAETPSLTTSNPAPISVGSEEIITAAGSYGDFMRYLQVLPGVVNTSDTSNEFLVRGGHPIENLFVVDGFEIPNLNHMAQLGSSGGLAPMIDSALVQSLSLHTGGYGVMFSDHLSSVTELNLLDLKDAQHHLEADLGIQGIGGLAQRRLRKGDLLVAGHRGLLDLVTKDAGMNGVPTYTNELARYHAAKPSGDTFTVLHLGGWDSIDVTPCQSDYEETSHIDSQYSGWRETTGMRWQRIRSPRSFTVLTVSDSEQVQHMHQQDQYPDPTVAHPMYGFPCPIPKQYIHRTSVYDEDTNNAVSSGAFLYQWANSVWTASIGTAAHLQHPRFDIEQPIGVFSPFSAEALRTDLTALSIRFSSGETGSFADFTYRGIKRLSIGAASRVQTIAFGSHSTVSWRLSGRYGVGENFALSAAFATYAQMPPYVYLVTFPENRKLLPMRAQHRVIGLEIPSFRNISIHVEAYDKPYFDTPVSSEFPTVTLHSTPSLLTDEIVWLRMNSMGRGRSSGIELSTGTHIGSRFTLRGSVAYARAKFAGMDGTARPSNFDYPWIVNLLTSNQLGRGYGISFRLGYASGRPYTPYDLRTALLQNRPIYDLSRVNLLRAPYYARVDGQLNKDVMIRSSHLKIYAGVDNILNRDNFLTYAWMPINEALAPDRYPVRELPQMPIFPNFGVRLVVR